MPASPSIDSLSGTAYLRASVADTARSWGEMVERRSLAPNLLAGLTVALVAIPLNLALAIAVGLPPGVGLVTGAIAGVVGALFGAGKLQITGPEIALAPVSVEIVARFGVEGLVAATFLAGLMQVAFGALRVGRVIHATPVPVVGGFMAAVGILVFDAQLPRLLGMPDEVRLLTDVRSFETLTQVDPVAIGLGALVIAVLVGLPTLTKKLPAPLFAIGAAVLVMKLAGLEAPTVEPIRSAWPTFSLPAFGDVDLGRLWPEALALAMLASLDSLLCAVSVDAKTGDERTRTDQELVAQGLANLASACFGGMPVAAAVVRSAAAVDAGATTRLAPLVQSLLLGVVLMLLAPFVSALPLVALAGVLLVVGARLVDLRAFATFWRVARFEAVVFLATAIGILATDFVVGVGLGVVASLVHFAHQQRKAAESIDASRGRVRLEGPLFFGAQDRIEDALQDAAERDHVVIDVSTVSTVDVSGAMALAKALRRVAQSGTTVAIRTGGRSLEPALQFFLDECRDEGLDLIEHDSRESEPPTPTDARRELPRRPSGEFRLRSS